MVNSDRTNKGLRPKGSRKAAVRAPSGQFLLSPCGCPLRAEWPWQRTLKRWVPGRHSTMQSPRITFHHCVFRELQSGSKTCHSTKKFPGINSGHVRPRQGTEICNFGAPSPLEALHWIFWFFSSFYMQFSKTSPLKSGENSEKSSGENRVKSCHVCGCHGFFGPD